MPALTTKDLDEITAQIDDTVPYYVPRLIQWVRDLLAALDAAQAREQETAKQLKIADEAMLEQAHRHAVWKQRAEAAEQQLAVLREALAEVCICAAIQLPDGELFRGHRHDDAIQTAGKAGVRREDIADAEQGFITSRNRFVGREEGARLQAAAGIPSAHTGKLPREMLFSEDLYLRSIKGRALTAAVSPTPEKG